MTVRSAPDPMLMERLIELMARTPIALSSDRLAAALGEHPATVNKAALALIDEGMLALTPVGYYIAIDTTRRAAAGMQEATMQVDLDEDIDVLVASAGAEMMVSDEEVEAVLTSAVDLATRRLRDAKRYDNWVFPDRARAARARAAALGYLAEAVRLTKDLRHE